MPDPLKLATEVRDLADRLFWAVHREDARATYPTGSGEHVSGGGHGNPTATKATSVDELARLAAPKLRAARDRLLDALEVVQPPRTVPRGMCVNCGWKTATHPRRDPQRCEACDRYLRDHGHERPDDLIEAEKRRVYERERREAEQRRQTRRQSPHPPTSA